MFAMRSLSAFTMLCFLFAAGVAASDLGATLATAQRLLDEGQPQKAIALLEGPAERDGGDGQALLLRSTAYFMAGDRRRGEADLDRALAKDPKLRQGWLNRAALAIADERYKDAQTALERARDLDPTAPDNDLNLGAVLVFQGQLPAASTHFERYLAGQPDSAEAAYLVATNYALNGYAQRAIEALRRGIVLDERLRVRARADSSFDRISDQPAFESLLQEDLYQPPAGAHTARKVVDAGYGDDGEPLLTLVIEALQQAGIAFEARVEVTPAWALLWGEMRIKLSRGPGGKGSIEVSAPSGRLTPTQWRQRLDTLFQSIDQTLDR